VSNSTAANRMAKHD